METAIIIAKRTGRAIRRELWQKPKAVYYVWHKLALGWDAWLMLLDLASMCLLAYLCVHFNREPPSGINTFLAAWCFAWAIVIWFQILDQARSILAAMHRADQEHCIGHLPEEHPLAQAYIALFNIEIPECDSSDSQS